MTIRLALFVAILALPSAALAQTPPADVEGDFRIDGNLVVNGTFEVNGVDGQGVPFGRLFFSGNELVIEGFGDTPKLRFATDNPTQAAIGAISGNVLGSDGIHNEVFLFIISTKEDEKNTLAGQLAILVSDARVSDRDKAMIPVVVCTAAYTFDDRPTCYLADNPDLGPFEPGELADQDQLPAEVQLP